VIGRVRRADHAPHAPDHALRRVGA